MFCCRPGYEPFQSLNPTTQEEKAEGETEPVVVGEEGSTEQQQRPPATTPPDSGPNRNNQLVNNQLFKDPAGPPPPPRRGQPRPQPENHRPLPFPLPLPPSRPNSGGGSGPDLPQRPEFLGPEPPPSSSTLSLLEQIFGTTTQQTVDIEPSFEPPVLVTPSSVPPQRRPFVQRPRQPPPQQGRPGFPGPLQRPPGGGRPPLLLPVQQQQPQQQPLSAYPTPPLTTTARPLVFPSRLPTPVVSVEPVESTGGGFQEPEVVTGFAIPADNDVFDLTVTAQQNYGGARPTKKYNGKNFFMPAFQYCTICSDI